MTKQELLEYIQERDEEELGDIFCLIEYDALFDKSIKYRELFKKSNNPDDLVTAVESYLLSEKDYHIKVKITHQSHDKEVTWINAEFTKHRGGSSRSYSFYTWSGFTEKY